MKRRLGHAVQRVVAGFERHGALYLTINRFLPGIRAFFFVAAGMARLSIWRVAFWGGLSAILWNLLVIGAGYALGGNLERLQALFARYTTIAWVLIGLVFTIFIVRMVRLERRGEDKQAPEGQDESPSTPQ